jgi:hypothetical protein
VRVIRDAVGDVRASDNTLLHENVRYQMDDTKRVAVFASPKTVAAPVHVYEPSTVETTVKRKPCSCKGDASRMRLTQAWMQADKVTA